MVRKKKAAASILAGLGVAAVLGVAPATGASATDDCAEGSVTWSVGDWSVSGCQNSDDSVVLTASQTWHLGVAQTVNGISQSCGDFREGTHLNQTLYATDDSLPLGVGKDSQSSFVGTAAQTLWEEFEDIHTVSGYNHWADGIDGLSITNWAVVPQSITITMHCDSRESQWLKEDTDY
jgi:hypothetical protein